MTSAVVVEAKIFWWLLIALNALVGMLFTDMKFYKNKNLSFPKATGRLPPWLFGVVWTVLYILQAVAVMLRQFNSDNPLHAWSTSLTLYVVALCVGTLFMPVFFKFHQFFLSALIMFASWGLNLAVLIYFFDEHLVSAWLMLPTQIWLTFATIYFLNIWYLNEGKKF